MVIGQSLRFGNQSVIPLIIGTLTGDLVALSLSFAGLGVLLNSSIMAFNLLKSISVIYLIYLGFKAWFSKIELYEAAIISVRKGGIYRDAFIVTALNPKEIMFFIVFFPLFLDTQLDAMPQMIFLAFSFLFISAFSVLIYSLISGGVRNSINTLKLQKIFNRLSGFILIGTAVLVAY